MLLIILLLHTEHNQFFGSGAGSSPANKSLNWSIEAGSEYSGDGKTLMNMNDEIRNGSDYLFMKICCSTYVFGA